MASHPSPGDNHQGERTQGQAKIAEWNSFSYRYTRALQSTLFPIFRAFCTAYTVIPLLPKAIYTPSIQPNLGLTRTHSWFTSAINTLLAIRYLSILFTCPNHHNTTNSLSITALLSTYSFLTLSIHDTPTKLLKHFISRTFTFLLSALLIPHASTPYNAVGTITPSYGHFLAYILYCSYTSIAQHTFSAPMLIPLIHSVYHILSHKKGCERWKPSVWSHLQT